MCFYDLKSAKKKKKENLNCRRNRSERYIQVESTLKLRFATWVSAISRHGWTWQQYSHCSQGNRVQNLWHSYFQAIRRNRKKWIRIKWNITAYNWWNQTNIGLFTLWHSQLLDFLKHYDYEQFINNNLFRNENSKTSLYFN